MATPVVPLVRSEVRQGRIKDLSSIYGWCISLCYIATCLALSVIILSFSNSFRNAFQELDVISDTSAAISDGWLQKAGRKFFSQNYDCIKTAVER